MHEITRVFLRTQVACGAKPYDFRSVREMFPRENQADVMRFVPDRLAISKRSFVRNPAAAMFKLSSKQVPVT